MTAKTSQSNSVKVLVVKTASGTSTFQVQIVRQTINQWCDQSVRNQCLSYKENHEEKNLTNDIILNVYQTDNSVLILNDLTIESQHTDYGWILPTGEIKMHRNP